MARQVDVADVGKSKSKSSPQMVQTRGWLRRFDSSCPRANPLCVHTILRRLPLVRSDRLTRRLMFCFPPIQQGVRLMPPRHRLLRLLLPGLAPAAALLTLLLCLSARGLAGPIPTLFLTPFSAPPSTGATAFGLPLPAPPPASTILPPPLHLAARAGRQQHARAARLAFGSKRHLGSRNITRMMMMMQGSSAASSSSSSAGESLSELGLKQTQQPKLAIPFF